MIISQQKKKKKINGNKFIYSELCTLKKLLKPTIIIKKRKEV